MPTFVHGLLDRNLSSASADVRRLLGDLVDAADGFAYKPVAVTVRGDATAVLQAELAQVAHDGLFGHLNDDLYGTTCLLRFSFGHEGYWRGAGVDHWTYGKLQGVPAVTVWFSRYIGARPSDRRPRLMEWVYVQVVEG